MARKKQQVKAVFDKFQMSVLGYTRAKEWLIFNGHCKSGDFLVKDGFAKVILANKLYAEQEAKTQAVHGVKIKRITVTDQHFIKMYNSDM